ncbi:MAG TPA: alpha/beta hydrolase-fold protein, partial [Polyangiaceae bacterium]
VAVVCCALAVGCSSKSDAGSPNTAGSSSTTAGQSSGGAGTSGLAGADGAGQSAGGASAGSVASAGTGGSAGDSGGGAGASGTGGSAGSSAGAGGVMATCGMMGTQADPGTDGDGKLTINGPYTPAPESKMHLNAAPVGKVNGMPVGTTNLPPLIYPAKEAYPGVNQMLKYEYWIYVPAQYKAGCPAALMVFQDGIHFVGTDDAKINAPTVMDNLIASGDMPVTIALFINPGEPGSGHYDGNEQPIRSQQYDTNSPVYSSFLIDEVIPAIVTKDYAIVTDPDGWGTSGHSSGGIAAFTTGWYHPEKFHKLLTLDASFPNTQNYMGMSLLSSIGSSAVKPLRVFLMSGPNDLGGWQNANTSAATALAGKGYHYQFLIEDSQHYPPQAAQQDFPTVMRWMWRGYKL